MNSSILFGNDEIESVTIGNESIYFFVEEDNSLWSIGEDEEQDDLMSELGIYNIQQISLDNIGILYHYEYINRDWRVFSEHELDETRR